MTFRHLLCALSILISPLLHAKQAHSTSLFDEHDRPCHPLVELLERVGMGPLNESEHAVVQINEWAQKHLLRQGERWEEQTNQFEVLKPTIEPLLVQLGFIDASTPHFNEYEGAIIHGALLPTLKRRLDYLIEQWKQGVRFSHLYFLSGERPLDAEQEMKYLKENSSEFPSTECEMARLLWERAEIPETMRQAVHVHFINAPMKLNGEKLIRPTTDDTVIHWFKETPSQGRYLSVSNAPYMNRQDFILRIYAPDGYSFDTIGPRVNQQEKISIILDELARFVFQIKTSIFINSGND